MAQYLLDALTQFERAAGKDVRQLDLDIATRRCVASPDVKRIVLAAMRLLEEIAARKRT